jgi:hypothetical protein
MFMRTLNYKQIIVLLVLVLCLLGLSCIPQTHSYSIDGKYLSKVWTGYTQGVGNVVVTIDGIVVWNSQALPSNNSMSFGPYLHGTAYQISWTDWRGAHTEKGTLQCGDDGYQRLVNDIPQPKSIENKCVV